jgi:hypothetical protein
MEPDEVLLRQAVEVVRDAACEPDSITPAPIATLASQVFVSNHCAKSTT